MATVGVRKFGSTGLKPTLNTTATASKTAAVAKSRASFKVYPKKTPVLKQLISKAIFPVAMVSIITFTLFAVFYLNLQQCKFSVDSTRLELEIKRAKQDIQNNEYIKNSKGPIVRQKAEVLGMIPREGAIMVELGNQANSDE